MSIFRRDTEVAGSDSDRVPPGQYITERFPVLHAGTVPKVDPATWSFSVEGLVDHPASWTFDEFRSLDTVERTMDIHCVTKWSKLDTVWEGVPVVWLLEPLGIQPEATHAIVFAEHGFTANLPLTDLLGDENLLAYKFDSLDLEPDHGWPLRLVVPHLYFWKSVKWVRGIRLVDADEPGFWERNGYHMRGDPWAEQRFWGD